MRVSVIISNYNHAAGLAECLAALENQTYKDFEVVLVDARSTDHSLSMVREHFPKVRVVESPTRIGVAAAINQGIAVASGDLLILEFNTDEVPREDWLQNLVAASRSLGSDVVCGWARLQGDGLVDEMGMRMLPLSQGVKVGHGTPLSEGLSRPLTADYLNNFVLPRKSMEQIGLFDEAFFIYGEDADYSLRARACGYRLLVIPTAVTTHKISEVSGRGTSFQVFHKKRSQLRLSLKRSSLAVWPVIFLSFGLLVVLDTLLAFKPFRLLWSTARLPVLSEERRLRHILPSCRSIAWNLRHAAETYRARALRPRALGRRV